MPLSCVAASSNTKMEDRISYAGGALWNFTIMALYRLNQPSSITEISNKTKHVIWWATEKHLISENQDGNKKKYVLQ